MAIDLILNSVIALAIFFDLRERRIPNWLILLGLVGGVSLNVFSYGTHGAYQSVLGFLLAIALFIVPFALGWMGAGDVKLFAAIGAVLGLRLLPRVVFYAVVAAGAMALISVALGRTNSGSFRNLWSDCKLFFLTLGGSLPASTKERVAKGAHAIPWGVAIGVGTIIAYYVDSNGKWSGF